MDFLLGTATGIGMVVMAIVIFFATLLREDNRRDAGAGGDNPDV